MQSVRFKAGDTFSFVGPVELPAGSDWQGRGSIRGEDGLVVDDLDVEIVNVSGANTVIVSRSAEKTNSWPRPSFPLTTVPLYFDFEVFDAGGFAVMSSVTYRVLVEFDVTRAT